MKISISGLEKAISRDRFNAYKQDGVSDKTAVARYLFNIEICKTLYPLINIFEVTLRNSIDGSLSLFCNTLNWENTLQLGTNEIQSIQTALQSLKRKQKSLSHDRLVAELNMGFWTALLGNRYSQNSFQYAIIKTAFKNCPKSQRNQKNLHLLLNDIRHTRNRIAHHERIIHWKDLQKKHTDLLNLIKFLNSDSYEMAINLDNFDNVFYAGYAFFENNLEILK